MSARDRALQSAREDLMKCLKEELVGREGDAFDLLLAIEAYVQAAINEALERTHLVKFR